MDNYPRSVYGPDILLVCLDKANERADRWLKRNRDLNTEVRRLTALLENYEKQPKSKVINVDEVEDDLDIYQDDYQEDYSA